jgi:hypothetical protein
MAKQRNSYYIRDIVKFLPPEEQIEFNTIKRLKNKGLPTTPEQDKRIYALGYKISEAILKKVAKFKEEQRIKTSN